jgi:hypothetical protein
MNLEQREAWFWRSIRADRPPPDVDAVVAPGPGLSPARRLGIYRAAYLARQVRVLEETFERTLELLGQARFRERCVAFLERHPSSAPAVELVGRGFADFLALKPEEDLPGIGDLARLEWARLEALLAPDAVAPLAPELLASRLTGESLPILHPSFSLLVVSRAILARWARSEPLSQVDASVCLAVFRRGFAVHHVEVTHEEATALGRIQARGSLESASECFSEPGSVARAAAAMTRWIRSQWIVGLALVALAHGLIGCGEPADEGFGFMTGSTMQPGDDCLRCHSSRSDYPTAPDFSAAGTVFPSVDAAVTSGVPGVGVELLAPDGALLARLETNSVGNFYTTMPLPDGFRVRLDHAGEQLEMPCPPPAGNCGACHSLPPLGEARGRIFVPGGGMLGEPQLDCDTWTRASP